MIRGTKNEGLSSVAKRKVIAGTTANYSGTLGESLELVDSDLGIVEKSDTQTRQAGQTTTPSGDFNGLFDDGGAGIP